MVYVSCTYIHTYMYRYGILDQYVCICVLYVYTYKDTYRYVLYEQWCHYLVRTIIRTNIYNTEYIQTCTYSYVFCTYIRTKIRMNTFYMCNGARILYVLYVRTRTIRNTYNTYKIIRTNIRTKYIHKNRYIYTYRIRHVCRQNEPAWEGPMGSVVRSASRPVSEL